MAENEGKNAQWRRRQNKAAHDPHLPHLATALNVRELEPALQEFFRREYPERGLVLEAVELGKVYHKPGKDCEMTYSVRCRDGENRIYAMWFQAKMSPSFKTRAEGPRTWPGCGFWKPIHVWPEMGIVLYTFPYDRKLPYLGQLLEPEWIKQQVEANLAGLGLHVDAKCQQVTVEKIKYMPGKRCVLRYEILLDDQSRRIFYGKTYDDAQGRHVFHALQKICASPACRDGRLNVPAPIAYLETANTVWQQAWESENFNAMMEKVGWANFHRTDFSKKIATMLAALHQIEMAGVALRRGPAPLAVLLNACDDASDIASFAPERLAILHATTKVLESTMGLLEASLPLATIHGSFKLAQLLGREQPDGHSQLALIDFDSIASGDPLYDVAEFVASLAFLQVSDDVPAIGLNEGSETFLEQYQRQTSWVCERRRLAWYVTAFLLGKIHSAFKRREPRSIKNLALAFALVQEWTGILTRR